MLLPCHSVRYFAVNMIKHNEYDMLRLYSIITTTGADILTLRRFLLCRSDDDAISPSNYWLLQEYTIYIEMLFENTCLISAWIKRETFSLDTSPI